MDIKEFKTNVINEIKTKLISILEEPTFSSNMFKHSQEYQQTRYNYGRQKCSTLKDLVDVGHKEYIHLPLTLLLNPEHEYSKRYKNHFIEVNIKNYLNKRYENLIDIVDITSIYSNTTTLKDRPLETVLAMNMTIMSYSEIKNSIDNRINNIITDFSEAKYLGFMNGNNVGAIFQITDKPIISLDSKSFKIGAVSLQQATSSKDFGKFDSHMQSITIMINSIEKGTIKTLTRKEVENALGKILEKAINTKNKDIENCEKNLANHKKTLKDLKDKQYSLEFILSEI